jgi:hypothetical protein
MPVYETQSDVDMVLDHSSFHELVCGLQRDGKALLCVHQKTLHVFDEQTYLELNGSQRVLALYRDADISPTV